MWLFDIKYAHMNKEFANKYKEFFKKDFSNKNQFEPSADRETLSGEISYLLFQIEKILPLRSPETHGKVDIEKSVIKIDENFSFVLDDMDSIKVIVKDTVLASQLKPAICWKLNNGDEVYTLAKLVRFGDEVFIINQNGEKVGDETLEELLGDLKKAQEVATRLYGNYNKRESC
jgi:hypothetical protein